MNGNIRLQDVDDTTRAKVAVIVQAARDWQGERITWAEFMRRADVTVSGECCLAGIGYNTDGAEIESRALAAAV
jgi:hypothetical protein